MRVSQLLLFLTPSSSAGDVSAPRLSVCLYSSVSAEQLFFGSQRRSIQCHTGETETTASSWEDNVENVDVLPSTGEQVQVYHVKVINMFTLRSCFFLSHLIICKLRRPQRVFLT